MGDFPLVICPLGSVDFIVKAKRKKLLIRLTFVMFTEQADIKHFFFFFCILVSYMFLPKVHIQPFAKNTGDTMAGET